MNEEQEIEEREHDVEHGHLDPVSDEHLDAVQLRYETFVGWHRD